MPERPPPKSPLENFTTAGRLLVIATIIFASGFFYWNVIFIHHRFPSGSYPLAFIMIPVLIGAALFFGIGYWILRVFGVRIRKDSDNHQPPP